MNKIERIVVERGKDTVEVLLLPHKDGRGWSFVNLTKGHICPCVFPDREAAMQDLEQREDVRSYHMLYDKKLFLSTCESMGLKLDEHPDYDAAIERMRTFCPEQYQWIGAKDGMQPSKDG